MLDEYIYSGEAIQSSYGPPFLDLIHSVVSLRELTVRLQDFPDLTSPEHSQAMSTMVSQVSTVKSSVASLALSQMATVTQSLAVLEAWIANPPTAANVAP